MREPQDGGLPYRRIAPTRACEPIANAFAGSVGRLYLRTREAPVVARIVKECPLQHARSAFATSAKACEVDHHRCIANQGSKLPQLTIWAVQELLQQTQPIRSLKDGGINGMAKKMPRQAQKLLGDGNPLFSMR